MNNAIVSQVHIDVQGSLRKEIKVRLVELSLRHLRLYNKDSYIIFTGHGYKPSSSVLDLCDYVYWEDKCRDLNPNGTIKNMPAQYFFVGKGIEHAFYKGFKRILKTRCDCIVNIPNINEYCSNIIDSENKTILLTQQTGCGRVGDCFMYGDSDKLFYLWNPYRPPSFNDGLIHTGIRYAQTYNKKYTQDQNKWLTIMRQTCSFRNINNLGLIDLRWNFNNLLSKYKNKIDDIILNNKLDINEYHWGKTNGWLSFNNKQSIINAPYYSMIDEKLFYNIKMEVK